MQYRGFITKKTNRKIKIKGETYHTRVVKTYATKKEISPNSASSNKLTCDINFFLLKILNLVEFLKPRQLTDKKFINSDQNSAGE